MEHHIYEQSIDLFCYLFLKALLDNYEADENKPEKSSAKEQLEEDVFVNAIAVNGGPIHIAFKYLQNKGKVSSGVSLYVSFVLIFFIRLLFTVFQLKATAGWFREVGRDSQVVLKRRNTRVL